MHTQLIDGPGPTRTVTAVPTPDPASATPGDTRPTADGAPDTTPDPTPGAVTAPAGTTGGTTGADTASGVPSAAEKKQRGQFFTRHDTVHRIMVDLVTHQHGRAAEPSAGAGHLVAVLETHRPGLTIDAVELDDRLEAVCTTTIDHDDFFTWAAGRERHYQVMFGNPPYVAWKDVETATRVSAADTKAPYSDKTNLYHLFIDRCIDLLDHDGEMVLIVPKEWLYTTSAAPLRAKLARAGSLTHVVDCGEEKLFDDADVPALLIFRWHKGHPQGPVAFASDTAAAAAGSWQTRQLQRRQQRWLLLPDHLADIVAGWGVLADQYQVRVGLVTGADRAYKLTDPTGVDETCVQWQVDTSRQLVPFLNANHIDDATLLPESVKAALTPHESALRTRKIARFGDHNWWKYGAIRNEDHMRTDTPRFFALAKTRSEQPFFTVEGARYYTGGVLGVFRKPTADVTVTTAVAVLNSPTYRTVLEAMFLTTGDKVSLQPSTLHDVPFPRSEADAQAFLDT